MLLALRSLLWGTYVPPPIPDTPGAIAGRRATLKPQRPAKRNTVRATAFVGKRNR